MQKYAHKLRSSKTTPQPRNLIFVDTETTPIQQGELEVHTLELGCAIHVRRRKKPRNNSRFVKHFTTIEDFFAGVTERAEVKQKYTIVAHNMHFDGAVLQLIPRLTALGWKLKSWFIDSNIYMMKWKKGNISIQVLDSGNIIKQPLADLGDTIGLQKLEVSFGSVSTHELAVYCERDTEILERWYCSYLDFIEEENLGCFKPTLASQAFEAFTHRFMSHDIFIHDNMKVYDLERRSYKGGRTECFYIGEKFGERFTLLDVNSMYPYVMREFSYPTKLKHFHTTPSLSSLRYALKDSCVIADVTIEIDEPVFAYRTERICFPTGRFRLSLTTEELKYVLQHGTIHKVHEFATYEHEKIFVDYVDFFYNLKVYAKQTGNKVKYLLAKLFMNSLYGKFGQNGIERIHHGESSTQNVFIEDCVRASDGKHFQLIHMGGEVWEMKQEGESLHSFPAIAAHVTANARLHLWECMQDAGRENCYYGDTDSLIVNDTGRERLTHRIDKETLGALDIQEEATVLHIRGPKDYIFGNKEKIKGIRKKAKNIAPNTFQQQQFLKTRSLARGGITQGAAIRTVTKHLTREYKKGVIQPDGRVTPFKLYTDDPEGAEEVFSV